MSEARQPRGLFGFSLLIISVAYLVVELGFNAHLVDLAGSGAGVDALERAETVGRTVAGVGAALMVFRLALFGPLRPYLPKAAAIIALVLAAGSGFGVWFGQRALIDYLVANADADTRRTASAVVLMKSALRSGDLSLNGYVLRAEDPGAKAFLGTLGLFALASPDVVAGVKSNADRYAEAAVENQIDSAEAFSAYLRAQSEAREAFATYQQASSELIRAQRDPRSVAEDLWQQASPELDALRDASEEARSAYIEAVSSASSTRRMLSRYFGNPQRFQAQYDEMVRKLTAGQTVDPQVWCAGSCPGSVDHVKRVTGRLGRQGLDRLGVSISGKNASVAASPLAQEKIAEAMQQQGLMLPMNWASRAARPADAFVAAAAPLIGDWAMARYEDSPFRTLKPGLDFDMFAVETGAAGKVRDRLGLAADVPVSFAWDRAAFDAVVWRTQGAARASLLAESVKLSAPTAKDAALQGVSDNAVRAAAVPPVAMAFSLFFGLANLITMLTKLPWGALMALPAKVTRGPAPAILRGAIVAGLIVVPLLLPWRGDVLLSGSLNGAPAAAALGHWLNVMEPALYPVTSALEAIPASLGLWQSVD